ncbi:nitroreductase/quinone reductase family protein [Cellulomonas alba]|uniref:Nitroreductase/quinone reductase family protein n=1 Tax=Cellulomonas alba TaxID=3053467 RepID=A0ABT7SDD6_9CELL|nr:nitroreductase/quinone reductase family protein [Cellulomonas alba]MDM7854146.1 nitroreductase/quinone reductase family protein [Cellulomonas alba]
MANTDPQSSEQQGSERQGSERQGSERQGSERQGSERQGSERQGADAHARDAAVVEQFRAGATPPGMHRDRLVLLTTTGRRTGRRRTTPLMVHRLDGRVLVVASGNASPSDPVWVRNVAADPTVHVELDDEQFDARARVLAGDERAVAWGAIVSTAPFLADHQRQVDREIPVVELDRV